MIICEKIVLICSFINIFNCIPNNSNNNRDIKLEEVNDSNNTNSNIKSINDFNNEEEYDNYLIQENLQCIICFNPLINNVKDLNCGHKYHNKCLNRWKKYKKQCPLCQIKI
jgi:hypothetical protein